MDEKQIAKKIKIAKLGRAFSVLMCVAGIGVFIAFFATIFHGFLKDPIEPSGNASSQTSNPFDSVYLALIGIVLMTVGSVLFSSFSNMRAKYDTGFKPRGVKASTAIITNTAPIMVPQAPQPQPQAEVMQPKPVRRTKICQYCKCTTHIDSEKCSGCGSRIFYYKKD